MNKVFYKVICLWILLSLVVWCGSGCVGKTMELHPGKTPESAVKLRGEGVMTAVSGADFAGYVRFAGEQTAYGDEEQFKNSCANMEKQMGKITGFSYLTKLRTPELYNLIFKVDFEREVSGGRKVVHQQLMQLIFGEIDGTPRLLGLRIM